MKILFGGNDMLFGDVNTAESTEVFSYYFYNLRVR
jgi:hypothetical protein